MRLWIPFCSDLAIRSGTAARLRPENYDRERRALTFTTKCGEKLTLPTTATIEALFDDCDMRSPEPFVRQPWTQSYSRPLTTHAGAYHGSLLIEFRRLSEKAGITRRIVPHDFRRTTAVAIYRHTADVRDTQALLGHKALPSTLWYLDHDLHPIKRSTLELIKP